MKNTSRKSRKVQTPFTIMAIIIIVLMVGGGAVGIVLGTTGSTTEDDAGGNAQQPGVRVTPGEEVARLQTAVAKNPSDLDSIRVLAEVLANSGRLAESIPWFEDAVTLQPDDVELRLAFGRVLQRADNWYDAELQLKKAMEIDPKNATAAYFLGQLYENMPEPRIADATSWYEQATALDPDSVIAQQARDRLVALGAATPVATPQE